jgi:hypothetical protein
MLYSHMKSSRAGVLLFLLVSAVAIPLLVVAVQKYNIFSPKASGAVPQYLTIANQTDTTATIVWTTPSGSTITSLQWGETNQLGSAEADFRDKRDKVTKTRKTHIVQLTGLKPNTVYYYRITSGAVDYPSSDQTPATFQTLTAPVKAAPQALTFYGDIASKTTDAIILLYPQTALGFSSSLPLATTQNSDGTWFVNVANARISSGEYQDITDKTPVAVIMHTESDGYVKVHTSAENPLSLTTLSPLTQAIIDQALLGTTIVTTPTVSATPSVTKRQDVPLKPKGSTPSVTPTGTTPPTDSADITKSQLFASFASPSVSNISDSSLTVMFLTTTAKESRLLYGTSATSLPSSKYDDANTGTSPRFLHHYTLTGLSANSAYFFRTTLEDTVRTITLPTKISAPSGQTIVIGELKNAIGECVVRTQVKRGNTISSVITTLPGSNYTWTTNIAPVRVAALDSYMVPGPTDTLLTNAFCVSTTGDAYYQSGAATVQSGMSSGITLNLVKLQ